MEHTHFCIMAKLINHGKNFPRDLKLIFFIGDWQTIESLGTNNDGSSDTRHDRQKLEFAV